MPKTDLYSLAGKKTGQISLPKEIFAATVNEPLMAQAVKVYLANQRKAGAKTKTRGEVIGTRKKVWRQKGTGRARHSDRFAPIFVGGGRAHGPTGEENYQRKMSKAMKRKALFSALTSKLKEKELIVIRGLAKIEPKTKAMAKTIESLPLKEKKKILLILPEILENVLRSGRNLAQVDLVQANQLHPYLVLNHDQLIFMAESLEKMKETYLGKKRKTK